MKFKGLAVLVALAAAAPAAAQVANPTEEAFRQLNDTAISIYRDAKDRFVSQADPVVIAGFDSIIIRHHGAEQVVGRIPTAYNPLKTIGHVPRSLWAAVRPAIEGLDTDNSWRGKLTGLRAQTQVVLQALPQAGLSTAAAARDERVLRTCLGLIDRYLVQGLPDEADLQREMRALAPAILADAAEAAELQVNAIDRDIRPWWTALTKAERDRTFVFVLGGKTARRGNLAYTYFVNLLGAAEAGHRVVYDEGIFDTKGADGVLATLLTDRRLAVDFFADERRMERDLLADGAEVRVMQLLGRLGIP
jgi:hypothetical protein